MAGAIEPLKDLPVDDPERCQVSFRRKGVMRPAQVDIDKRGGGPMKRDPVVVPELETAMEAVDSASRTLHFVVSRMAGDCHLPRMRLRELSMQMAMRAGWIRDLVK